MLPDPVRPPLEDVKDAKDVKDAEGAPVASETAAGGTLLRRAGR
jgi:hypothetical protein